MQIEVEKISTRLCYHVGSKIKSDFFFFIQVCYSEEEVTRKKQLFQSHGFDYFVQPVEIPYFHGSV